MKRIILFRKQNNIKNEKGITLIALVVTIIVLLILAGVSLNLIGGSNGILGKVQKAVNETKLAQLRESLELANAEILMDKYAEGEYIQDLYDYIESECEKNSDKTVQTSSGKYWLDDEDKMHFTSMELAVETELEKDRNGNPAIKDTENSKPVLSYQIKYHANGGTGKMANSVHEIGTTKALTANGFSKSGYTFTGWATTADGEKIYENQAKVTDLSSTNGDIINLYAIWTVSTDTAYKVVHQQMNVDGKGYTTVEIENKTGTTDANVTPEVKTYTGFTSPSAKTVKIAGDGSTTVTYQYTRNKYTITYDSNGGSNCTATTAYYGASISMPSSTKDRYSFSGWNTNYTTMPAENVTVIAIWEGITATQMKGEWYGDSVNYGNVNGCSNWKVFSKDENNIYLIAGDLVIGSTLTLTENIQINGNYVYTTNYNNTTLENWMTTINNWSKFMNTTYTDQATGGPTLAQLAVSANGKLGTSYDANSIQGKKLDNALYNVSVNWWLASPYSDVSNYMWIVRSNGTVGHYLMDGADYCGVRPLVRLKSNVKLTWNGSVWDLSI